MSSKIEVLLIKQKRNLGYQGDVVSVKRGFARNFLIRNGFVVVMNKGLYAERDRLLEEAKAKKEETADVARKAAVALETHEFVIKAMVDVKGGLYGSVTAIQIASLVDEFCSEYDLGICKKSILMHGVIKHLGSHVIDVRLFKHENIQVIGHAKIKIVADRPTTETDVFEKKASNPTENVEDTDNGAPKEEESYESDSETENSNN
ncbi:MAG: 50S ribosomal protein L9 [Chlamydiia bacterium]|nr:50S ribosomal protein L9 [Chlamydiia bacterium]